MLKKNRLILFGLFAALCGAAAPVPEKLAPMGVYLSWEIPAALAARNQVPQRDFLEKLFALCRERHVNYLWVTNLPWDELPLARELAAKYGMRLGANCCDGKFDSYFDNNAAELLASIQQMVHYAGGDPNFTEWVLSDEPAVENAANLNFYAAQLRQADPARRPGAVLMPHTYPILAAAGLDFAAVDAYPFFAPGDPNGPHTRETSIPFYRSSLEFFGKACRAAGTEPWGMPQSFVEILGGPYRYNEAGEVIALPGSYLHWRMPTVPEIRWQFYEALRLGMRGICFYELVPIMPWNEETATRTVPEDFLWPDALLDEAVNAGPAGLTTPWGATTPQFDEIGALYQAIEPYRGLIARWEPAEFTVHWGNCPVSFFSDPVDGKIYAVAVNDDFERERTVQLEWVGGKVEPFRLPPGGGRIFEVPRP